jgi:dihydrolipoamide dehydrogenase
VAVLGQDHDLVVLGGGPAGYAAGLYGAAAGLDVALVEEDRIGGTCLHRGCVPAKELLQTAEVLRTIQTAHDFGVEVGLPTLDLGRSQSRKQKSSTGSPRASRPCCGAATSRCTRRG